MSFVTIFRSAFFFLCFLFSLLGYSAYQLNVSIDRKDDALRHQVELRFLGEQLAIGSDYLTDEIRSYVQFGDKFHYDNFWREVNKTRSRDRVIEKLKSLKVSPENLKYIEIAKEYSDNLIKTEKEAMKEVAAGNYRAARKLVFGEYYADQKNLIMDNIENFQIAINKIAFSQTREAESNAEIFINLTNFLLILSGLMTLFFFYFIGIKQLVEPLNSLTGLMLKMAQGNLAEKSPDISQNKINEIGAMASTLDFLKSSLVNQNKSEARFTTIFEESPLGVALIDSLTGKISEVNVKFAEIAGRSLDEMSTIDWMSITHPDDVQEDLDNMAALNSGEISGFNMKKRYIKTDGSHVWINMTISPLTVEDKNKPLHLCMIEDITEKKNSEKDLTRFGRVLSSSSNEIYMFSSLTLKFIQVNLGACKNLGYSMNELSQRTPLDLKPNITLEVFEEIIKPLREKKEVKVVFETVHKRKDKSLYPVNVNLQLIHEESPPLFVAIIEDITNRKKVEMELKQYQNNLEEEINRRTLELKNSQDQLIHSEKLSTLGAFASTVAHEFNNPLFGLINLVDQLGENLTKNKRQKYSKIAQKECWRMADMIKNLQSFYKPSEGVFTHTKIDEVIEGALLLITKACEIKRIHIKEVYNTDIFSFEVIEDQITQVILNILQNSIDSISSDEGKITLTLDRTNSNLILKIQDNGEGIKTENLNLIFDPFFTTKGQEGTGLGLSISYGIVKSHGGEIVIESELGVGSTVTLNLPITRKI
jgi:PAS domain S-box-containing protein